MSTTARLCELLEDYGVEHWSVGGTTRWRQPNGHRVEYEEAEYGNGPRLIVYDATPEMAIAATVGETCHMELLPDEPTDSIQPMRCTSCGHKTYAQLASFCPHCGARVTEA